MSHFTVVTRLPADVAEADLPEKLHEVLLPYVELGTSCANDEDEHIKKLMYWQDNTEEVTKDWEALSAAEKQSDYNNDIRTYAEEYYGYEYKDGKYGRLTKDNQHWDWYSVGGRWRQFFPVRDMELAMVGERSFLDHRPDRPKAADVTRIENIDWDYVNKETERRLEVFVAEYRALLDGAKFDTFEGPRHTMLDIGMMDCIPEDELTAEHRDASKYHLRSWTNPNTKISMYDVTELLTDEQVRTKYGAAFMPLKGYARLDLENGWQAPGEMGMFGCSSDTPDTYMAAASTWRKWYESGDQKDWVVLVDCHI